VDPTKEQNQILCRSWKKCDTDTIVRGRKHEAVHGKSKLTETEKGERGQEHCSSFSLTSSGLLTKNSSWQAKESVPHTTVTSYGVFVKMCQDFAPKFDDKRTG
jgi:hypothetical protein